MTWMQRSCVWRLRAQRPSLSERGRCGGGAECRCGLVPARGGGFLSVPSGSLNCDALLGH